MGADFDNIDELAAIDELIFGFDCGLVMQVSACNGDRRGEGRWGSRFRSCCSQAGS
jgi:hypothetical protein